MTESVTSSLGGVHLACLAAQSLPGVIGFDHLLDLCGLLLLLLQNEELFAGLKFAHVAQDRKRDRLVQIKLVLPHDFDARVNLHAMVSSQNLPHAGK